VNLYIRASPLRLQQSGSKTSTTRTSQSSIQD
jgi:hypothetical protein